MKYEIIKVNKEKCRKTEWSGGDTIELCIYPKEAEYKSRNFKWRVSTATVNDLESDFTKLSNIKRVLMLLNGQMMLDHEGYHKVQLDPFEKDIFDGEWNTKSYGRAVDFNIMMDKSCMGDLLHIAVEKEMNVQSLPRNETFNNTMWGFYLPQGKAVISCNDEAINCEDGDLVCIYYSHEEDDPDIKICSDEKQDIVEIHIEY